MENELFILRHAFGDSITVSGNTLLFHNSQCDLEITVDEDFPLTPLQCSTNNQTPLPALLPRQQSIFQFLTSFIQLYQCKFLKQSESKIVIFDTHAHFLRSCYDELGQDFDSALRNKLGPVCIIQADPRGAQYEIAVQTSQLADDLYFAVGIHPFRIREGDIDYASCIARLQQFCQDNCKNPKFVALGESGFSEAEDNIAMQKKQKASLLQHFQLCEKYEKTLIVHAHRPFQLQWVIDEATKYKKVRGIAHGFGGTPQQAVDLKKLNWYGSFNLLSNSQQMKKTYKAVGLDFILLETDSPYAKDGSQPMNVRDVAQKLSEAIDVPVEEVVRRCNQNASAAYNIE